MFKAAGAVLTVVLLLGYFWAPVSTHAGDPCARLPESVRTTEQLARLGIQDADVGGRPAQEVSPELVALSPAPPACTIAAWNWPTPVVPASGSQPSSGLPGGEYIASYLWSYATPEEAHSGFIALAEENSPGESSALDTITPVEVPATGEEWSAASHFTQAYGVTGLRYLLVFRRGGVLARLSVVNTGANLPDIQTIIRLSQLVDGRIAAALP